jgi:hypothetical protein
MVVSAVSCVEVTRLDSRVRRRRGVHENPDIGIPRRQSEGIRFEYILNIDEIALSFE